LRDVDVARFAEVPGMVQDGEQSDVVPVFLWVSARVFPSVLQWMPQVLPELLQVSAAVRRWVQ
jgi:hypothetical protein